MTTKGSLWTKDKSIPLPTESEFSTFESHFVRSIRNHDHPDPTCLLPHQLLSDTEFWQDATTKPVPVASIQDNRLSILIPSQWHRIQSTLASNVLPGLSSRMMDRVEREQGECRVAMGLLDDLALSESVTDRELSALLLEYVVAKKEYVGLLRQARRDVENVNKQALTLLELLKPYRCSEFNIYEE